MPDELLEVDFLTPEQRSAQMSRVRGTDTKIELAVRHAMHRRGLRYRLGGAGLPGRPDIVLPKHRAVVFVHGCFWHGHECHLYRLPKTRTEFWQGKVEANRSRDTRVVAKLEELGWHVHVVWECSLRGIDEATRERLYDGLASRIRGHASV